MFTKRALGLTGEALALRYLKNKGYTYVDSNYYFSGGEIDLILRDASFLVFVEVKLRSNTTYQDPAEAITKLKIRRILKGAMLYISEHKTELSIRLDIIYILLNSNTGNYHAQPVIEHYEDVGGFC